jgi:hypothetical protein
MGDKEFRCKQCPASYTRFSALKQHMIDKHIAQPSPQPNKIETAKVSKPKQDSDKSNCEYCGKLFSNKYNMQRHMDTACNPSPEQLLKGMKPGPALSILTSLLKSGRLGWTNNNTQNITHNTNNGLIDNHVENNLTQNNLTVNQSIHINPLGQENLDHISEERRVAILRKGINAVGELYKAIMENPENHNLVITNKRLKKAMYKDRNGEITIGDLHRVLNMVATDNIDRIDDFLEKYKNLLSLKDKTILRLMEAQCFPVPGEDPKDYQLPDDSLIFDYHTKCENLIMDIIDLHKKRILTRLNKHAASLE